MSEVIKNQSFLQYKASKGVNQSTLSELASSPKHLAHYLKYGKVQTAAMKLGRLVHTLVFSPEQVDDEFTFIDDKKNKRSDKGKAEFAEIEAEAEVEGKTVLKEKDHRIAVCVAESVLSDPVAGPYLKAEGDSELSLYSIDPETGLLKKGRIDKAPKKANFLLDLKTTQDASLWGFKRSVRELHYDVQGAFYVDLYSELVEPREEFVFVAVETTPPYAVGVYFLSKSTIEEARRKYKELLVRYRQCVEANYFPGYTEKPEELGLWVHDIPKTLEVI